MAWPFSPKKESRTPQYKRPPRNLKYSQALATRYEKEIQPPTKRIFVGREEYIAWKITIQMQTTTNQLGYGTKCEKFQKLQSNFFFFCLRYVFTIFYTGSFQVSPKKNHPNLKSHPTSKFDISPSYMNLLKNGSAPPPSPIPPHITWGEGAANYGWVSSCTHFQKI